MSIEIVTVTHAGGRWRRSRVLVAAVITVLVVGAGAAVWAWGTRSTPAFRSIALRAVESSAQQPCTVPPLTTDAAGSACDASGTHTYELGERLGDLHVTRAAVATSGGGSRLSLELDERSRATLADVTGAHAGQQVAWVVDGVVLSAPTFADASMDVPELVLAAGSSAEAATWLDLLGGPSHG